jgi:tryptophan-rich sensory protein
MWYSQHFSSPQAISIIVPVAAGFLVSMLGQKELLTWYKGLNKPKWQPPAFLFGALLFSMLQLLNSKPFCLHISFMLQILT